LLFVVCCLLFVVCCLLLLIFVVDPGTAMLFREGLIDSVHKAALKELILRSDKRVLAAVEVYEADHDDEEILDTLTRIARRGVEEMMN